MRFEGLLAASLPSHPLDSLYSTILTSAFSSAGEDQKYLLERILQVICVAREPLTTDAMDELLGMRRTPNYSVSGSLVSSLRSVLSDGSGGKAVQILHPTFLEYLLRAKPKEGFVILKSDAELLVARGCLAAKTGESMPLYWPPLGSTRPAMAYRGSTIDISPQMRGNGHKRSQ